jgi:hypothetical protein
MEEAKKDANAKTDIVGTWSVSVDTPQGKNSSTVTFTKEGGNLTGKVSGDLISTPITFKKVELDGNKLKYSYTFSYEGTPMDVEVEATVEGDTYTGNATAGSYGSFPLDAKKNPKN